MGRYDEQQVMKEIKDLLKENEDIKCIARELKSEIEYGKQRENKLMYFLFLMQQKEYPVFDIFEEHIKDLPTSRFSTNLDDKFKEIYIEQKKKMKAMGLIGDFDFANTERAHKMNKLDKKTEMSFMTEESYMPIQEGPTVKPTKPKAVPNLDLNKMNVNLEKQKKQAERDKRKAREEKKVANSDPNRRAASQNQSDRLPENLLDPLNHNKYGNQQEVEDEYEEGESSPWSWSYWLRKEAGKGGIEELLAINKDNDDNEENTQSFHSSILHENRGKYKNIKELRRLYEVMKSYDEV